MCLIVASDVGEFPDTEQLTNAFDNNNDGWGIVSLVNNRYDVRKGFKLGGMLRAVEAAKGRPYVLHFRWATHGTVTLDNVHPFKLGRHGFMAHNGVLSIAIADKAKSDTWHLAEELMNVGFEEYWANDLAWLREMGGTVGKGNKLAFLTKNGISLVNEEQGRWHGGYWLSNEHSVQKDYLGLLDWKSWAFKDTGEKSGYYSHFKSEFVEQDAPIHKRMDEADWDRILTSDHLDFNACDYCECPCDEAQLVELDGLWLCPNCLEFHTRVDSETNYYTAGTSR